jgi:hypothetical protein
MKWKQNLFVTRQLDGKNCWWARTTQLERELLVQQRQFCQ